MQQSTRRRWPPARSGWLAGLVAFALSGGPAAVTLAAGDDGVETAMDAATAGRSRWIEPRRRIEPETPETTSFREWRSGARVVVHAAAGDARLAGLVTDLLVGLGAEDVERRAVDVSASTDQVRFFHAEDAAMAAALAAELESLFGEVRVRDLTFYRPLPESGALEVWLR